MERRPVSIKDVAAHAGVSIGTVSNVLNARASVRPALRERVERTIESVGYVRNGSASRLRASRSRALGLVVVDVGNPFFADVVRSAERTAEAAGYIVMLCNSDSTLEREHRHLRFLEEQRVAGILVSPISARLAQPHLDALEARGTSVVLLDASARGRRRCSVSVDDVHGGELAGRHLLDGGRRRITYVAPDAGFRQFEDRLRGLRGAIVAAGASGVVARHAVVRVADLEAGTGAAAAEAVLATRPDAVFCANDVVALHLTRALEERGVRVPDDVAVIGYDDIGYAALAATPLSSVRQPAHELGATAARLLLEECADPHHQHQQVVFRPELVVRASTGVGAPVRRRRVDAAPGHRWRPVPHSPDGEVRAADDPAGVGEARRRARPA